jgi:hypothetical protein
MVCNIDLPKKHNCRARIAEVRNFPSARIFAALCAVVASMRLSVTADEVTLQDDKLLVTFDSGAGALTRLEDIAKHWTIGRRQEL